MHNCREMNNKTHFLDLYSLYLTIVTFVHAYLGSLISNGSVPYHPLFHCTVMTIVITNETLELKRMKVINNTTALPSSLGLSHGEGWDAFTRYGWGKL